MENEGYKFFKDFVGNKRASSMAKQLISNFKLTGEPIKHLLLTGPSGCGKTTLAETIVDELHPSCYFYMNSTAVKDMISVRDQLVDCVPDIYNFIFFDECHALPAKVWDGLLSFLEYPHIICTVQKGVIVKEVPSCKLLTFIFATTNPESIPSAAMTRLIELRLELYTGNNYLEMIKSADKKDVLDDESAVYISEIIRNPRQLSQWMNFFEESSVRLQLAGEKLCKEDIVKYIEMLGFNEDGLRFCEYKILQYIAENSSTSVETLSAFTDINKKELITDVEPFLVKKELLTISSKGRELTDKGRQYVAINESNIITERVRS